MALGAKTSATAICLAVLLVWTAGVDAVTINLTPGWRFQPDPAGAGRHEGWFASELDDSQWKTLDAGVSWSRQGFPDLKGAGWYRKEVALSQDWHEQPAYLAVGQVDDGYDLYVNGTLARSYHEKDRLKRSATVTRVAHLLRPGQTNLIVVRVSYEGKEGERGGLTGPVALSTDKRAFTWEPLFLDLDGDWRFSTDPGGQGLTDGWYAPDCNDSAWSVRRLESSGWTRWPDVKEYRGEAWYRIRFEVPADWRDEPVLIRVPAITGPRAVYLNGRLVSSSGFSHPPAFPRVQGSRETEDRVSDETVDDVTQGVDRGRSNLLVIRVRCEDKSKAGLRGTVTITADRRALVPLQGWKAVTSLANAEPDLILPGWATGRGSTHTITGPIGSEAEVFAAPDGSFSPSNRSFSVTVWVYDRQTDRLHAGEKLPLDQLRWRLADGRLPFPESAWQAGPVHVETTVFARPEKFEDQKSQLVFYRCRLENQGDQPASLLIFVAIRPYSIPREHYAFNRGYNPVRELTFYPEWNAVAVNGRWGVVSLKPPAAFGCTSFVRGGDVGQFVCKGALPADHAVEDWCGLGSGAYQFALDLPPRKAESYEFVMPMTGMEPTPEAAAVLRGRDWKAAHNAARDEWKRLYQTEVVSVRLPDRDAEEAFYASVANMLVLKDGDALIPGSFGYNAFWTRDAAYMIDACLRAGLIETARKAAELWTGFQKNSGEFPSMGSGGPREWDGQGQATFAFVQVYRYTRDRQWLARVFPHIVKGAEFIDRIRREGMTDANKGTPLWGILTPSVSAEDLGPPDWHSYWDDFWCIRGLQDALFAADELGEHQAAGQIRATLTALHESTRESIRQVMSREKIDWIPVAPESAGSSGRARGTSPAIWPGGAFDPDDPIIQRSFDVYWDQQIAPRQGGYWHGAGPWPYAGLALAHCYLNLGQPERSHTMLRWALDHQSAPGVYGWAELADGKTNLFLGGDIPHGWAAAEYVSLVRDMLVREVGNAIHLAAGVTPAWLEHGKRVELGRAKTTFGAVEYRLHSKADAGQIEMQLKAEARPPDGFFWPVPPLKAPVTSVSIDGRQTEMPADRKLPIPPDARQIILTLKVDPPRAETEPYRARMASWRSNLTNENVYASVDTQRPLLGVYFYFEGADEAVNTARLRSVREAFDFVQISPQDSQVDRCERIGLPWMGVDQPAIPLGRDSQQWGSARSVILDRTRRYRDSTYLLGWNDGSEPHTSFRTPGYTGHTEETYKALGVAEPTRKEFIEWLAGQYADASPSQDTSGDGITFNRDFNVSFDSWEAVAQPANRTAPWFEQVLVPFRRKLIRGCVAGRIDLFHQGDPTHKVSPRLLRSLDDPRMSYDLTYLNLGDAAGVTFYCGGGFNMDDPQKTGARVETKGMWDAGRYGFGLTMRPPVSERRGIVQSAYRIMFPGKTPVIFKTAVRSEGTDAMAARVEAVEDLADPDAPGRTLVKKGTGRDFAEMQVDLTPYAGKRVWLRLVGEPGGGRGAEDSRLHWLEPRIEAGGATCAHLVSFYRESRAGYRLASDDGEWGPLVWLGMRGGSYQAWYADHVMSLVANRARLAGKRPVANEFHPGSGSADAMFPFAIYDSLIRLMQFRLPSVAYFCHMYKGEFTNYSMANSEEHVARARNQMILWNAYESVPAWRRSSVACFMPSGFATPQQATEAARQFGTGGRLVWALGELGADFYLLNDLDQARHYDKVVIFLASADREAEEKLHRFLTQGFKDKRVLILTSVSRLWGPVGHRISPRIDASLLDVLPASPVGSQLVEKRATLLPGLTATMRIADSVHLNSLPGFNAIVADDGTPVGARSDHVLCLAGFPDTSLEDSLSRGWRDTNMRRLVHRWLEVEPGLIDAGAIKIVNRDMTAREPAIYCIEDSSVVRLEEGLAGYDVLHQNPVDGWVCGPTVLRAWPASQPRLIDTDICMPLKCTESESSISALLVAPECLKTTRHVALTVYKPGQPPRVSLNDTVQSPEPLGRGFYRVLQVRLGIQNLRVE